MKFKQHVALVLFVSFAFVVFVEPLTGFLHTLAAPAIVSPPTQPGPGVLIFVNSTGDGGNLVGAPNCDADLATPGEQCTLRAAIQAANLSPGDDGIEFSIPTSEPLCDGSGRCVINLNSPLPNLSTSMEIFGPGPDRLTVRRASVTEEFRIFKVTTPVTPITVFLSGMTLSNGREIEEIGEATVDSAGGAIQNYSSATVHISNCILSVNDATLGGGIFNAGTMYVTSCTLGNNSSRGGGGIYNTGTLTVSNTTVSNNQAQVGGGISNHNTMTVTNSTFRGNSSTSTTIWGGGGIFNEGLANIKNSTISSNSAALDGGGIYSYDGRGGSVQVSSSIIALNTAGPANVGLDVFGDYLSGGFNLIGKRNDSTGFTQTTDQTGTILAPLNPQLDPAGLRNNGGSTMTIALQPGSPAIDRGTSNSQTTDQRGTPFERTFDDPSILNAQGGDGTDVGAYEVQAIVTSGSTLVSESCPPANGAVDPGERVSLSFSLINNGTSATTNLIATLQPSANVIGPSGPQSYGALAPGSTAARTFTFTAAGNCGDQITVTLQLQDGAANLGSVNYTVTLGTPGGSCNTSCQIARLIIMSTTPVRNSSGDIEVGVSVQNTGAVIANSVVLTAGTLTAPTTSGVPLPQSLGDIGPGQESTPITVTFSGVNNPSGALRMMRFEGTFAAGTFSSTRRVTLP